jgi:hypothetical protein
MIDNIFGELLQSSFSIYFFLQLKLGVIHSELLQSFITIMKLNYQLEYSLSNKNVIFFYWVQKLIVI